MFIEILSGTLTTTLIEYVRQRVSVSYSKEQSLTQKGLSITKLSQLEEVGRQCVEIAMILEEKRKPDRQKIAFWLDLASIITSLSKFEQASHQDTQVRILLRYRDELNEIRFRAGTLNQSNINELIDYWITLVDSHVVKLGDANQPSLWGAYQAGTALNTESSLFKGRKKIFRVAQKVYDDAEKTQLLLLIAQQRMGKSSIVWQLPVELPDAHVVIVDAQRMSLQTALFPVAFSHAITYWEKRQIGGVRLSPLDDEKQHELMHLNQWLETFADKARKRVLLCIDEFDKLVSAVAEGKVDEGILGFLRGLSQAKGWMVLYCGQFELDDWSDQYAEYLKNVERVRVSYLRPDEARDLIVNPVPNFALTYSDEAVERILYWTGRQPFLIQLFGKMLVDRLAPTEQRAVSLEDVERLVTDEDVFDDGRYYFQSIVGRFRADEHQALTQIAHTGTTDGARGTLRRLKDREYIETETEDRDRWRFRVPLLREWFLVREDES